MHIGCRAVVYLQVFVKTFAGKKGKELFLPLHISCTIIFEGADVGSVLVHFLLTVSVLSVILALPFFIVIF